MTGTEIREARAFLGMSQAAFADILGVSRSAPQTWENGKATPPKLVVTVLEALREAAARDPSVGSGAVHLYRKHGLGRALYLVLRTAYDA